jgi:hypothetical protein
VTVRRPWVYALLGVGFGLLAVVLPLVPFLVFALLRG